MLAGAIAYYTLLSIIPALALILLLLSSQIDQAYLLDSLHHYLTLLAPNAADLLIAQVKQAVNLPELAGGIGVFSLILLSGLTFRMIDNALQVIFSYRSDISHRNSLLSLVLPYLYVMALALIVGLIATADAAYSLIKNTALLQALPLPDQKNELG